jgi:hypothetical protein
VKQAMMIRWEAACHQAGGKEVVLGTDGRDGRYGTVSPICLCIDSFFRLNSVCLVCLHLISFVLKSYILYIRVYLFIFVYIYRHVTYIMYMHINMYIYILVQVYAYAYVYVCMYVRMYMYMYMYM